MGDTAETLGASLIKYDLETGKSWTHDLGAGRQGGEPVFAASTASGAAEDDGWIMNFVYDKATDTSEMVIADASHFDAPPVARIKIPQRVPFGFHGSWRNN